MNQLPRIDPALLRQMQQIDADLERARREYRRETRPSKLAVAAWSVIGLLTVAAVLYPIVMILK